MQDPSEAVTVLTSSKLAPADVDDQLGRILRSPSFRNSTVLQLFLRFVTEKTTSGCTSEISEYTIATEVFGRASDFNPAADTIVRTQAYRLRLKLDEYYRTEGASDPVLIEIPKGHYFPTFCFRRAEETIVDSSSSEMEAQPSSAVKRNRYRGLGWAVLLFTAAFVFGVLCERVFLSRRHELKPAATNTSVDSFWQSFLESDKQPIVAYTNALYLTTDLGDLFSFRGGPVGDRGAAVDPGIAQHVFTTHDLRAHSRLYFEDDMTGVGDVLAAVAVSNALIHAGGQPSFKRGRLLTTYDLESHNVVFIGSPFVNEVLYDLPNQPKFVFDRSATPPKLWTSSRIEDAMAENGHQASYTVERAPDTQVLLFDYALISGLAGLKQGRRILILGGLTTSGTAAAAQFTTSSEGIAEMRRRIRGSPSSMEAWPGYFEYLIRVQLSRGLDVVRSECVATHF